MNDYRLIYARYIASHQWEQRRLSFFARHGRQCRACRGTVEIELHHRSYEHFTAEPDDDLVPLCSTCHMWVHQLERTTSATLAEATDAVLRFHGRPPRGWGAHRQGVPFIDLGRPPALGLGSSADAAFAAARQRGPRHESKRDAAARIARQRAAMGTWGVMSG